MESGFWPLQQAIYTQLTNNAALMSVITGVYDEVSSDAVKPYATIGDFTEVPWGTKDVVGENVTVTMHSWSDYAGKKEAMQINSLMLQAMTDTPLSIGSSFVLSFQERVSNRVFTDIDGTTRHGVLTLRFKIRKG